jgi:hypothetical protein
MSRAEQNYYTHRVVQHVNLSGFNREYIRSKYSVSTQYHEYQILNASDRGYIQLALLGKGALPEHVVRMPHEWVELDQRSDSKQHLHTQAATNREIGHGLVMAIFHLWSI